MTYRCVFHNGILDIEAESADALLTKLNWSARTVMILKEGAEYRSLFDKNWDENYVSIWDVRNIPDDDGELGW